MLQLLKLSVPKTRSFVSDDNRVCQYYYKDKLNYVYLAVFIATPAAEVTLRPASKVQCAIGIGAEH